MLFACFIIIIIEMGGLDILRGGVIWQIKLRNMEEMDFYVTTCIAQEKMIRHGFLWYTCITQQKIGFCDLHTLIDTQV